MDALIVMSIGVVVVFLLCLFLNRVIKFSPAQAASIVSLICLAVIIPYSIAFWPGGDKFALYISSALITTYAYYLIGSGGIKALSGDGGRKIHWAPIAILGFFLFLMIVDGSFVVMAERGLSYKRVKEDGHVIDVNTRFPGEVPNAYHKKEAYYNEYQDRLAEQQLRGWKVKFGFDRKAHQHQENFFMVQVLDKKNQPLEDAQVVAHFTRSAEQELNKLLELQMTAPGLYEVPITFERRGPWNLELEITKGDDRHEIVGSTHVECPVGEDCYKPETRKKRRG